MPRLPELPAEWPPTAGELAGLATAAHWQLEELAFNLPRHQVTRQQLDTAANGLEALAHLLRRHQPGN